MNRRVGPQQDGNSQHCQLQRAYSSTMGIFLQDLKVKSNRSIGVSPRARSWELPCKCDAGDMAEGRKPSMMGKLADYVHPSKASRWLRVASTPLLHGSPYCNAGSWGRSLGTKLPGPGSLSTGLKMAGAPVACTNTADE